MLKRKGPSKQPMMSQFRYRTPARTYSTSHPTPREFWLKIYIITFLNFKIYNIKIKLTKFIFKNTTLKFEENTSLTYVANQSITESRKWYNCNF